jgi:hypothetical protein
VTNPSDHVTNPSDHVTNPLGHVTHVICTTIIKFDLDLFEELVEGGILWTEGTSVEVDGSSVHKKSEFCYLYVSNLSVIVLMRISEVIYQRFYLMLFLSRQLTFSGL